jgi:hypothetical protein
MSGHPETTRRIDDVTSPNPSSFWLRKLVSPAGLLLGLMLLFMPFVGVACGPFEAEISGWDMAVGGEPSVSSGGFGSETATGEADDIDDIPVQPIMVVTVLLMLAGIVVGLAVRVVRTRALCGVILAGLATVSIGLNEAIVLDKLVGEVAGSDGIARGDAAELVGTRAGFWLTLSLFLAILAYHVFELWLEARPRAYQAWPGFHGPPPAQPYPPPMQTGWQSPPGPYPQPPGYPSGGQGERPH